MSRPLSQIAPPTRKRRAQFLRETIRKAVREAEYARIRKAYEAQPDSEDEADDWSTTDEYKP